ncbi:MAG: ABC transporter permease [Erysipelothrix sp.]|nr:ABC transporter permease [Erysipelothrix sp.]
MTLLNSILEHIQISFLGVLMALVTGVVLAALMNRQKLLKQVVFIVIDVIQTVPTLAMFTFVMLVFGLNNTTVIVSVFLYSLFPIIRNTYTGIASVSPSVIRAARGIGMTDFQIYTKIELPIALPVIITGVKLALVSALSITTTGVLIGAGGLGMLVWRGIQTRNTTMMLSGAVPVSVLAILTDWVLSRVEKWLVTYRS